MQTGKPAADSGAGTRHKGNTIDAKHIDVLDGVRALAVFGVLWFHFWQQNWIMPNFRLPFLQSPQNEKAFLHAYPKPLFPPPSAQAPEQS